MPGLHPSTEVTDGRKAATQKRILGSSMKLFASRGFDRTSISQIAAGSGVSRATIFWHFGDKATLFKETCRHFLVPFREAVNFSPVQIDPCKQVKSQLEAYERFITENRDIIHAFVSWVFSSPQHADSLRRELLSLHSQFQQTIERSLNETLLDPAEAAILAATVVSLLHGNMLLSLGDAPDRRGVDRWQLVHTLVDRSLARASGHAG